MNKVKGVIRGDRRVVGPLTDQVLPLRVYQGPRCILETTVPLATWLQSTLEVGIEVLVQVDDDTKFPVHPTWREA